MESKQPYGCQETVNSWWQTEMFIHDDWVAFLNVRGFADIGGPTEEMIQRGNCAGGGFEFVPLFRDGEVPQDPLKILHTATGFAWLQGGVNAFQSAGQFRPRLRSKIECVAQFTGKTPPIRICVPDRCEHVPRFLIGAKHHDPAAEDFQQPASLALVILQDDMQALASHHRIKNPDKERRLSGSGGADDQPVEVEHIRVNLNVPAAAHFTTDEHGPIGWNCRYLHRSPAQEFLS